MLDILDKCKVNPKLLEHLQKQARDRNNVDLNNFDPKLETKGRLMNNEKGFCVQHRREYYNDFEDCLRDYKNAKIKSIQKQTKVHLSDGDNGDSDAEYVDCADTNELRHQSTHKSMPHVSSGNYQDNFCQQLDAKSTTRRNETEAQKPAAVAKAQLNTNYDVLPSKHETLAQLTSHNNNNNRIIDSRKTSSVSESDSKVSSSEKSIDDTPIPSTSSDDKKLRVNQSVAIADKHPKSKPPPVQIVSNKDEQTRRKSCKKKQEVVAVVVQDPSQR